MTQTLSERYLRRLGVTPLVRPTRSQAEVTLLPPYGDPEVNLAGEFSTYVLLLAGLTAFFDRIY